MTEERATGEANLDIELHASAARFDPGDVIAGFAKTSARRKNKRRCGDSHVPIPKASRAVSGSHDALHRQGLVVLIPASLRPPRRRRSDAACS